MESSTLLAAALVGLLVVACDAQSSVAPNAQAGSAQGGDSAAGSEVAEAGVSGESIGGSNAGGAAPIGGGSNEACGGIVAPHAWSSWPMPNPVKSGLPNPMSYTVSASGNQVTDNVTLLIWQRIVAADVFVWADAKQYCACLGIDGTDGWRLPSRVELSSLADWTAVHPSLDTAAFPDTPSEAFWSSSVLQNGDPDLAWHVDFDSSHTSYTDKTYTHRARCVRGGSPDSEASTPPGRYMIASGTVLDTQTKLTWEQTPGADSYTWPAAAAHCAALSLQGSGWRVPSIAELQTIVDEAINPAVNAVAFPMTPSEYFWSSSAVVDDQTRAWDTFFANGSTYSFAKTMQKSVRCVR